MIASRLVLALALSSALAACGSNENTAPDAGPDAFVPVSLEYDQLLEVCVRLAACEVERHPFLRQCLANFNDRYVVYGQKALYESLFACANKGGGDCKVIRQCLGFAGYPKKCDASHDSRCEGEVAVSCDLVGHPGEGWEQRLDCARGGLKCGVKETGDPGSPRVAVCGGGTCPKGNPSVCETRRLLNCVGGALEINDCPGQGLQCRDPAVPGCEGLGRSCTQVAPECKGSKLVKCQQGYLHEVDCAKLPGKKTCDQLTATCRGTGTECPIDGFFDTCEGDSLVVCLDGFKRRYDCKALGFLGCEQAKVGYGAYCKAEPVYPD
jgi:hypothetical protein